jgi:hypothetical protein
LLRIAPLTLVLLIGPLGGGTPCYSNPEQAKPKREAEPTREACLAAVEQARALAATLPADHLSRYFAERYLLQAMAESGNGEFDECLEYAVLATDEVKELRHVLQPGETLRVLRPDE